ncbi:MAG: hypothetical protein NZ480_00990 [Bdellovibrionaceae bacterium]|nr:hypothetical protein [Pseudobdellovibrionaceae bacterium]MDW8190126.1 hypothetical protein [Pseudobdellovibrionaceae bacterium]
MAIILIVLLTWIVPIADAEAQVTKALTEDINEVRVVEVRHHLALNPGESRERDFYLNGGLQHNVRLGKTYLVYRKVPVTNVLNRGSLGLFSIPVGEVKVIWQNDTISVARLVRVFERSDLPLLEVPGILIGDVIDLKNQFSINQKSKND